MFSNEYEEKYLKYKNKYLNSKQTGGRSSEPYHIYFCFNKELTSVALESLKDFKTYDLNDINCKLNLGAYTNNFNTEIDLVVTINSERKLIDSFKLPRKLFIKEPLDKIKCTSKINLINIIKSLEGKINPSVSTPTPAADTTQVKTGGAPESITISDVLLFLNKNEGMELISHNRINGDNVEEVEISEKIKLEFVSNDSYKPKSKWSWKK
jgi:hypothetical protein